MFRALVLAFCVCLCSCGKRVTTTHSSSGGGTAYTTVPGELSALYGAYYEVDGKIRYVVVASGKPKDIQAQPDHLLVGGQRVDVPLTGKVIVLGPQLGAYETEASPAEVRKALFEGGLDAFSKTDSWKNELEPLLKKHRWEEDKAEMKALAGAWKLASVEEEGKAVPKADLPAISFTLEADGKSTVRTPDGEFQTSSVIDPTQKPKTVDIEYLGGVFKGQKQYGIYKVDGDRWTVFSTPPGGKPEDRPREFDSKKAKGGLVVWERVKNAK